MSTSDILTFLPDFGYERENDQRVLISETDSGKEQRRLKHTKEKSSFRMGATNMTFAEKVALFNFWKARDGQFDVFLWEDLIENPIVGEVVDPSYSGSGTVSLEHTFIIAGSFTIFADAVALVEGGGADYTIDLTTGVITFVTPASQSGKAITADYRFRFKVRFNGTIRCAQTSGNNYRVQIALIEIF